MTLYLVTIIFGSSLVDDVNWCCGAWQKFHLREIIHKAADYEQW